MIDTYFLKNNLNNKYHGCIISLSKKIYLNKNIIYSIINYYTHNIIIFKYNKIFSMKFCKKYYIIIIILDFKWTLID